MSIKTTTTKLVLISSVTAVILIGFYTLIAQDKRPSNVTSAQQPEQVQRSGRDPFKEYLDKQREGTSIQSSEALQSQPIPIGDSTSAISATVGIDPFKAFLESKSKAKPEVAAISPFSKLQD